MSEKSDACIVAVNTSRSKGERKQAIACGVLRPEFGLESDAHAGNWHRQVSLLGVESIRKIQDKGIRVGPGDFAENITTQGLDLPSLPIGSRLLLGGDVLCEVTQIGKTCHARCEIFRQAGDCVMPREGIFVRVLEGGEIRSGDRISIEE